MKTIKSKCEICGEVEVDCHFEGTDGEMSIPVAICPTLKDIAKYYKDLAGISYFKNTGCRVEECFEKRITTPSHECPDEIGHKKAMKHLLEPMECWREII